MIAVALTIVFVLSLATLAFAMTHSAEYKWDGTADMQRQVGHLCNTGAEQKVNIEGDGWMERASDITISAGKLTVDKDSSVFETAEDAAKNLTVTSVIELCAPPKSEYTTTHYEPVIPMPELIVDLVRQSGPHNVADGTFLTQYLDVTAKNPENGKHYDDVYFVFTIEDIDESSIYLMHLRDNDSDKEIPYHQADNDVITEYWVDGVFEMEPGCESTTSIRIRFYETGTYTVTIDLFDVEEDEFLGVEETVTVDITF